MTETIDKDCFERFGDDFCGLVLSYLSFDDSLRHECVSKQWQRLVFSRREQLIISWDDKYMKNTNNLYKFVVKDHSSEPLISLRRFKTIVKKCPNITAIHFNEFFYYNDIFDMIVTYCHRLQRIHWDFDCISKTIIKKFAKRFGRQLKTIALFGNSSPYYRLLLTSCPSVTRLDIHALNGLHDLFVGDQLLMKKLKHIRFWCNVADVHRVEQLIDSNRTTLESIDVHFDDEFEDREVKAIMTSMAKLSKLTSLTVESYQELDNTFIGCMAEMAVKCEYIAVIDIQWDSYDEEIFDKVYTSMKLFPQLKRLRLSPNNEIYVFTNLRCETLKTCPKLTHLEFHFYHNSFFREYEEEEDFHYVPFDEEYFEDIDKHLPQLQVIHIGVVVLTEKVLETLFRLKHIQELRICSGDVRVDEDIILEKVLQNWPKIQRICFQFTEAIDLNLKDINMIREKSGRVLSEDIDTWVDISHRQDIEVLDSDHCSDGEESREIEAETMQSTGSEQKTATISEIKTGTDTKMGKGFGTRLRMLAFWTKQSTDTNNEKSDDNYDKPAHYKRQHRDYNMESDYSLDGPDTDDSLDSDYSPG